MSTYSTEVQEILSKPTATVAELKTILGIGVNQTYQYIRQGNIRVLRIGSRILIPTSAIRELLGEDDA